MSRIPDCRTDEYYNEKYLGKNDKAFVAGYDWAVSQIINLFNNLEVYPDLKELLDDKKAVIKDNKVDIAIVAIEDWAEMQRDELITSMIDGMDEKEYQKIKELVDGQGKEND